MYQAPPTPPKSDVTGGMRRGRAGAAVTAFALVVSLASCASGGASGDTGGTAAAPAVAAGEKCSFGCLVPGPQVASRLSISATDTLPEINPRTNISPRVNNAINQNISQNGWSRDNRCLRRFGGPQIYVVSFKRECNPVMGPDNDPGMIVGFDAQGQVIGQVTWTGPATVTYMRPERRF